MDPVRATVAVTGGVRVQERAAGGQRGNAEAFRRALQQGADDRPVDAREPPVRSPLQPRPAADRRDAHPAPGHVDVLA
jgi:hypothetical protein